MDKYPILDASGKARQWLAGHGGIIVWRNQEIGVNRPDRLTPAPRGQEPPTPPHWAYAIDRVLTADDVIFYQRSRVVGGLYKTAAGADRNPPVDSSRCVPVGHVLTQHTLEELEYRTEATRNDGRPLDVFYRYGWVEWTAIVPCPLRHSHGVSVNCECFPTDAACATEWGD